MGAFIVRQPNGLLCRFSTITDCPTHYNLTEKEYIEIRKEMAEEDARDTIEHYIRPFSWLRDYFFPNNMSNEEFEEILKKMEQPVKGKQEGAETMTEQKMKAINAWVQTVNKNSLEMQDKLAIAGATMEMLEKLEPIYDKYQRESGKNGARRR